MLQILPQRHPSALHLRRIPPVERRTPVDARLPRVRREPHYVETPVVLMVFARVFYLVAAELGEEGLGAGVVDAADVDGETGGVDVG